MMQKRGTNLNLLTVLIDQTVKIWFLLDDGGTGTRLLVSLSNPHLDSPPYGAWVYY